MLKIESEPMPFLQGRFGVKIGLPPIPRATVRARFGLAIEITSNLSLETISMWIFSISSTAKADRNRQAIRFLELALMRQQANYRVSRKVASAISYSRQGG